MISWAVVGHEARLVQATDLARTVGAVIALDDGSKGADANHLQAWAETATMDTDWCGVLEDDAQPVLGFNAQAELASASAPAPVVSFYLGRGRPVRFQQHIPNALQEADTRGAHWLIGGYMLHAVGVAMRTTLRDEWLDWATTSTLPIDERLGAWCRSRRHAIAYTIPSLLEHGDLPTLVRHRDGRPRDRPRVAWRTGTREQWNCITVSM